MLAKAEATVEYRGRLLELRSNEFCDGTLAPRGFEHLNRFHLKEGVPVWCYALGDALLEQRIWTYRAWHELSEARALAPANAWGG
jgi:hypothetical protein